MNDWHRGATRLLGMLAPTMLLAGCGSAATTSPAASTVQPAAAAVTAAPAPAPTTKGILIPSPTVTASADPAAMVRAVVTAGNPRLLPGYVPSGMSPTTTASAISYMVNWTDDLHTRTLGISVNEGVNPPPLTDPNRSSTQRQLRGVQAVYAVYDTTAPGSQRYLLWYEPGTWSPKLAGNGLPGIEYFLVASGVTESEFFRVADTLQPVG